MTEAERLPANSLSERIHGVEVFRWMPRRYATLPDYQPENFGDSLAREIVKAMVAAAPPSGTPLRSRRLLSIGSILHFARSSDTVWGSGINGKVDDRIGSVNLDVRAVRGPNTRRALMERGIAVPPVYGDPGLLLPELFPETREWASKKRHEIAIVPNFNDATDFAAMPGFVNPLAPLWEVIRRIAQSEFVIASSLHGIIVAEALGVPVRPLVSAAESVFKYDDYALGTGRTSLESAPTVDEALSLGPLAALEFDTGPLRQAFPHDLWRNFGHTQVLEAGAVQNAAALEEVLRLARETDDEVIVSVSDPADEAMEPLRAAASGTDSIRLIGTPQSTRGARLSAALSWARGTTASVLGEGEQRIPRALDLAQDALISSGAALAFTRVQEYGEGPDEYGWGGPATGTEPTTLRAVPSLVGFQHPSGMLFSTEHIRKRGWTCADRDSDFLLAPLITELNSNTAIVALDVVSALHRRSAEPVKSEISDSLQYFADMLEKSGDDAVRDTALARIPALWRPEDPHSETVMAAASRLASAMATAKLTDEQGHTLGLVSLAALGFGDLASLGFASDLTACPGNGIVRFAEAANAVNQSASTKFAPYAAKALLELLQPLARRASRHDMQRLHSAILDLDLPLRSARPELLAAAIHDDLATVAVLAASPGDALIEHAAQTPLGWVVTGTVTGLLNDNGLRVWVVDHGAAAEQSVGRLQFGRTRNNGRVAFTGFIRSVGAPSGMLELRARHGGPGLAITTVRRPAGKFVHQMLHPVELPLDGGNALLVRRTAPPKAVLARFRQQH